MKDSEKRALITLLEDPDWTVYQAVKTKLIDLGEEILPDLRRAWEESKNDIFLERSIVIISDVQFQQTFNAFKTWVESDEPNLFEGAFLIAKYNFPDLDFDELMQKVDKIKRDAWLQMNDNLTPLEQIRVLNHIIFNIHKFTRNNIDFYSPKNSYLNLVLETKKGNPVSLAILYLAVGVKLGLPIYGVNLPKNFILAYVEDLYNSNLETDIEDKIVSFYINPYNNGAVLTKREIDYFLRQQKIKPLDYFYVPCDNHTIIQRMLLNLIFAYERQEEFSKAEELRKFLALFKKQLPDFTV
ncbi:MAG: transglutaminase-like domain-containing protein [Bacteroidales bacterium]|nr:transglutaminase-like domain-containing protein [Bacteroidales bacterium]